MNSISKFSCAIAISALCAFVASAETTATAKPIYGGTLSPAYYHAPKEKPAKQHQKWSSGVKNNSGSFFDTWINDRLSIGLTVSMMTLTSDERPIDVNAHKNFIGNVTELHIEAEDEIFPSLVINYELCDYARLGVTYGKVSASTLNWNNHLGDGVVKMQGPMAYLDAMLPLCEKKLVPHAGFGCAFFTGDFEEDTWWQLGYSNPADWEAYGRTNRAKGHFRRINVDDENSFFWQFGLTYRPFDNFGIDLSYRRMLIDPKCNWGYVSKDGLGTFKQQNVGDFDLSNYAVIFAAFYYF